MSSTKLLYNKDVLTKETINELLDYLVQEVGGTWILIGGALALLSYNNERATHDIDLIYLDEVQRNLKFTSLYEKLKCMQLSPEQINSASKFYLDAIPGWQQHTQILKETSTTKVLAPTLNLFLALKLKRATDIDINDCLQAIKTSKESYDLNIITTLSSLDTNTICRHLNL